MKIISWNVRWLGSWKKRTVKDFLKTVNPEIVMLQETKKETCDRRFVGSVWNGRDIVDCSSYLQVFRRYCAYLGSK